MGQEMSSKKITESTRHESHECGSNEPSTSVTRAAITSMEFGIGFKEIEHIYGELESGHPSPTTGHKLMEIVNKKQTLIMNRFETMSEWKGPEKQMKFLRVFVEMISSTQSEHMVTIQKLMAKAIECEFINNTINDYISPMTSTTCTQLRTPQNAMLLDHFVHFLCRAFEILPTRMDRHLNTIRILILDLKGELGDFVFPSTTNLLAKLEPLVKARTENIKSAKVSATVQMQDDKKKGTVVGSLGQPPENFRDLTIEPTANDMKMHRKEVYLRPAKRMGSYDNDEHFLDVQFRLMREDLFQPLREGINQIRRGEKPDLFVYKDVTLGGPNLYKPTGKMLTYAVLKVGKKRMRWNKRLIYGSLVCLSADNFHKNFLFASLIDRDNLETWNVVGLQFCNESVFANNPAARDHTYSMVESPAFFEAYKHVMSALQQMYVVPFASHIVSVKTETKPPIYVENSRQKEWDFSVLLKNDEINPKRTLEFKHFQPQDFGMDQSQFDAFSYALESELAIIQGPPGCGKTYLGLHIVKLLMANLSVWHQKVAVATSGADDLLQLATLDDRPAILLVCYTNHALDQFMEGILSFMKDGLLRIGGRCKNPEIEKVSLGNIRKERPNLVDRQTRSRIYTLYDEQKKILNEFTELGAVQANNCLPHPRYLADAIFQLHMESIPKDDLRRYIYCADSMFVWLTGRKQFYVPHLFENISYLMKMGFSEVESKRALSYFTYGTGTIKKPIQKEHVEKWLHFIAKQTRWNRQEILDSIDMKIRNWPQITAVRTLMIRYDVPPEVSMCLLNYTNGNFMQVLQILGSSIQQQQKLTNTIPQNQGLPMINAHDELQDDELPRYEDKQEGDRILIDQFISVVPGRIGKEARIAKIKYEWDSQHLHYLLPFARHINSVTPMPIERAKAIKNLRMLSIRERWSLYRRWVSISLNEASESIKVKRRQYSKVVKQLDELHSAEEIQIMRQSKIIGMTTTGAAKHQTQLQAVSPQIIMVEEAAEVLESHLVTSLTQSCEQVILIGDHEQLRPNPSVYDLAKRYNLEISLFQRLIENGYPFRQLKKQHRMHPDISRTLMPHFYQELQDDPSVNDYPTVRGMQKRIFFLNHSKPEDPISDLKSHKNQFEAEFVVRLVQYFLQQDYEPSQITVLTTYLDQFLDIRQRMARKFNREHGVKIENVDNYQGEESDIIILSLVRSNNSENKIGYLNVKNRVCVALSRAKHGFFVVGNIDFLVQNFKPDLNDKEGKNFWASIYQSLQQIKAIGPALPIECQNHGRKQFVSTVEQFDISSLEGGCDLPCNYRMDCGHTCQRPCHWPNHEKFPCTKPCPRKCPNEHECRKLCYLDCGICPEKIDKTLPCGHETIDRCGLDVTEIECVEPCKKLLKCGHQCTRICGKQCTFICRYIVEAQLSCGHLAEKQCYRNLNDVKCSIKVQKQWPVCGHNVEVECHTNVESTLCPHECLATRSDCEHPCKGRCGECRNGRIHIECHEDCRRILVCGHECQSKCSNVCPPCEKQCETTCGHSKCCMAPNGESLKTRPTANPRKGKNEKGGRTCGEPCPPCREKCLNHCDHRACTKNCGDICDVEPCMEPCAKPLPCSPKLLPEGHEGPLNRPHLCVGMCGEKCPPFCRICNDDQFKGDENTLSEVFLGQEDETDAHYVCLVDCGHYFEVNDLDRWVAEKSGVASNSEEGTQQAATEIIQIPCPRCKTIIRRSYRYISLLNQRERDIQGVKKYLRGSTLEQLKIEWDSFVAEIRDDFRQTATLMTEFLKEISADYDPKNVECLFFTDICQTTIKALNEPFEHIKKQQYTKQWLNTARNVARITTELGRHFSAVQSHSWHYISYKNLENELTSLLSTYFAEFRKEGYILRLDISAKNSSFLRNILFHELLHLFNRLSIANIKNVSESTLQQITCEIGRFGLIFNLLKWLNGVLHSNTRRVPRARPGMLQGILKSVGPSKQLDSTAIDYLGQILRDISSSSEFKDDHKSKTEAKLEKLIAHVPVSGLAVTNDEIVQIKRALSGHVTRFYKCSKGHIYGIGDCGLARMTSRCPDCGETIGGDNYHLVGTSQDADELNALAT